MLFVPFFCISTLQSTHLSGYSTLAVTWFKWHEHYFCLFQLTFVAADTLSNLSDVRVLDLSHNRLNSPPSNAWHTMLHLNRLMLAGNPFTTMSNDSFMGLDRLEWLDIGEMNGTIGTVGRQFNFPTCTCSADLPILAVEKNWIWNVKRMIEFCCLLLCYRRRIFQWYGYSTSWFWHYWVEVLVRFQIKHKLT